MKRKLLLLITYVFLFSLYSFAQDPRIKFGKVGIHDFDKKIYSIDSGASAVVIADIGSSAIEGNSKSYFSLIFKKFRRAHILNKNGFDIGEEVIYLYTSGDDEEKLENLKATTYNLENGNVVETKLDTRSAVFKNRINKNVIAYKFNFPNLKPGSIIEYEYRIKSDFLFNLQPWTFQGEYPVLWSEYTVALPEFYNYTTLTQGYQPYAIKEQKERRDNFVVSDMGGTGVSDRTSFTAMVTDFRWVMKDVPAIKEEEFTSTINNHIAQIEFQLSGVRAPFNPKTYMSTWEEATKELMQRESFGASLKKDNSWLSDLVPTFASSSSSIDKARTIYTWIRDNFTCIKSSGIYMDQTMRNLVRNKKGSVAEINLLLVALLRKADLIADPVILGTRSKGYTHSVYPLMDRFNYVICRLESGGKEYFLDASDPLLGFGKLGYECYNGHARIIFDEEARAMELVADSLKEMKSTAVFVIHDDKGKMIGSFQQTPGYLESVKLRGRIKELGKREWVSDHTKSTGADITTSNERVDSLNNYDVPLGLYFDFDIENPREDIIYFNPMFGEGYKENPFKSAQRYYPVEMPYTIDDLFSLQLEVPKGYVIDEIPSQAIVKFNEEEDAIFEYRISESGGILSLRSRLRIKRTWFGPEEYPTLREFFNLIVKKHNEQIVFRKKK